MHRIGVGRRGMKAGMGYFKRPWLGQPQLEEDRMWLLQEALTAQAEL